MRMTPFPDFGVSAPAPGSPIYPDSPQAQGLICCLPCWEGAGSSLGDVSGFGHAAKLVGGATYSNQTPNGNYGIALNGTTGYVQNANYAPLVSGDSPNTTISMWCFSALAGGGGGFGFQSDTFGDGQFCIIPDYQQWSVEVLTSGGFVIATASGVAQSVWHHIVATVNFGALSVAIYVDGVFVSSAAIAGTIRGNSGGLLLGRDNQGTPSYSPANTFFDFRLYSYALQQSQITDLYNDPFGLWRWPRQRSVKNFTAGGVNSWLLRC